MDAPRPQTVRKLGIAPQTFLFMNTPENNTSAQQVFKHLLVATASLVLSGSQTTMNLDKNMSVFTDISTKYNMYTK